MMTLVFLEDIVQLYLPSTVKTFCWILADGLISVAIVITSRMVVFRIVSISVELKRLQTVRGL